MYLSKDELIWYITEKIPEDVCIEMFIERTGYHKAPSDSCQFMMLNTEEFEIKLRYKINY